jgi:hypothetical protein
MRRSGLILSRIRPEPQVKSKVPNRPHGMKVVRQLRDGRDSNTGSPTTVATKRHLHDLLSDMQTALTAFLAAAGDVAPLRVGQPQLPVGVAASASTSSEATRWASTKSKALGRPAAPAMCEEEALLMVLPALCSTPAFLADMRALPHSQRIAAIRIATIEGALLRDIARRIEMRAADTMSEEAGRKWRADVEATRRSVVEGAATVKRPRGRPPRRTE